MVTGMAAKKKPNKSNDENGAPLIVIDWEQVDSMCKIQCTGEEIASVLNINYSTLERACKREKKTSFADHIAQKKLGGKASLRRHQWKLAQDGNATMLIWLGKNMLGQLDRPEEARSDMSSVIEKLIDKLPN